MERRELPKDRRLCSKRAFLLGGLALTALYGSARAQTPFTTYAFPATGASASRSDPDRWGNDFKNVLDFGADPTGATDSTTKIQAAINAAAALGTSAHAATKGAWVFFPPGAYLVSASLVNNAGGSVRLIGSGMLSTVIFGSVSGYIIDQNAHSSAIISIEDMTISNSATSSGADITVGAIRFNNAQNGLIKNVDFTGWTGIDAHSNTFETTIINCQSSGPGVFGFPNGFSASGPIGIYFSGGGIYDTSCLGYNVGMLLNGNDITLLRTRTESSGIGVIVGADYTGVASQTGPVTIESHSTERCYTGIYCVSWTEGSINGCVLQGTIGPAQFNISNMIWSSGSGGVATVTLSGGNTTDAMGWTSGTRLLIVEGCSPSGFNTYPAAVTATRISSTSFSYPLASNPGTFVSAGDWAFECQYGLRIRGNQGPTRVSALAVSIIPCQGAGVDLYTDGNTSGQNCVLESVGAGPAGWNMPPSNEKFSYSYISCDQPTGTASDQRSAQAGMNFADLPGQVGISLSAVEGMEYDIVDCNASTFLASAAGGGSGSSAHRRVRYNAAASAWQVVG